MNKQVRMLFSFLAVCSMLVMIVACGSNKGGEASKPPGESQSASASGPDNATASGSAQLDAKGSIDILWQQDGTEGFWDYPLKKFKEKYPNVEVKLDYQPKAAEMIRTRLISGNPPDICYSWASDVDFFGAIKAGQARSVDDILSEPMPDSGASLGDKLFQTGLETGKIDGKHYLLPMWRTLASLYYSGKFFTDNQYPIPNTWDEFMQLSEKIKKDGKASPLIYPGVYPFYLSDVIIWPSIANIDITAIDKLNNLEAGAWKQPAVVQTMQKIQEMRDKGYFDKGSIGMDHIQSQSQFINYKAAMVPVGTWLEPEMAGQWPDGFKLLPMKPPFKSKADESSNMQAIIEFMMIPNKEGQDINLIKELLKLFYSDDNIMEVAKKTGNIIGIEDIGKIQSLLPVSVSKAWEYANESKSLLSPVFRLKYKSLFIEYQNNLNALISGRMDAQAFCDKMEELSDKARQQK